MLGLELFIGKSDLFIFCQRVNNYQKNCDVFLGPKVEV